MLIENIKAYKDGDRLVIIIENCKQPVEDFIKGMISGGIQTLNTELQMVSKVDEQPIKLSSNAVPLKAYILEKGMYAGKTISEVLSDSSYSAALEVASQWEIIPDEYKTVIQREVIEYFRKNTNEIETHAGDFFIDFAAMYETSFNEFYSRNEETIRGMGIETENLQDFVFCAPDKTLITFAKCFVKKYES